jgi:hypothetical protein
MHGAIFVRSRRAKSVDSYCCAAAFGALTPTASASPRLQRVSRASTEQCGRRWRSAKRRDEFVATLGYSSEPFVLQTQICGRCGRIPQ